MDGAMLHSFWTVLLLLVFVGIVVWVFILKRPSDFEDAARMPLEPDETEKSFSVSKGRRNE
ncbi:MAG: cbb3-type cytochrome c oxidase subunit 3 [Gammaproteobacteria bacterium]|nr:cbb3-type cytochrome c oxidase subunit 3 [Gammaproteobacteria bacterium]MDH3412611.1 cbb3-type cytochrome c oxidase subunit 3 [Gammaproteobacteria bacterium]